MFHVKHRGINVPSPQGLAALGLMLRDKRVGVEWLRCALRALPQAKIRTKSAGKPNVNRP